MGNGAQETSGEVMYGSRLGLRKDARRVKIHEIVSESAMNCICI